VLWLSKHGSECATGQSQYPNTAIDVKQAYWKDIMSTFEGLLVDFSTTSINETTISEMVHKNQRVVIYASDYVEFTGSSMFALDGCKVDNQLGPSISDEPSSLEWEAKMFEDAESIKSIDKKDQKLFLMSMATGSASCFFLSFSFCDYFLLSLIA
jgi:hypothetical protein